MTISQLRTLCWRNLQILSLRRSRNSARFCHAGQVGRREDRNHHRQYPTPWRRRISASGATQSVLRTHQQHFANIKNLWGRKKKTKQKKPFLLGGVSWVSLVPQPSPRTQRPQGRTPAHLGVPVPPWPGDGSWGRGRGRRDGLEEKAAAASCVPAQGAGRGWAVGQAVPGLWGWGAAARRGTVSYCFERLR